MTIINVSRVKVIRDCAAKWHLSYERNLVPTQKGVPLIRGSSMHSALATWFKTGSLEQMLAAFETEYRQNAEEGRFITEELQLVDERVREGRNLLTAYTKNYPVEPWEFPKPETVFKVFVGEKCFYCNTPHELLQLPTIATTPNIELNNVACSKCDKPIHVLVGRTDLLVMWKQRVWIVEHKTHSQVSAVLLQSYGRGIQGVGYVYGVSKALKMKISGFILNVLKTTKVPDFVRDVYMISEAAQLQFVIDLYKSLEDVARWKAEGHWVQNTNSCFDWFRPCAYLPFCDRYIPLDQITDEEIIQMGFERRAMDYADETFIQEDKRI